MTTKIHSVPNTAATTNPASTASGVHFNVTPWQPKTEFGRVEELAKKLVAAPRAKKKEEPAGGK
jgi:hypothetical protein